MPEENILPEVQTLHQKAYAILQIPEMVLFREDLGTLGFGDLKEDFRALRAFCTRITQCAWKNISTTQLLILIQAFETIYAPINRIKTYDPGNNIHVERQNIIQSFRNQWINVCNAIAPTLCFCENAEKDVETTKKGMSDAIAEVLAAKQSFDVELSNMRQAMNKNKGDMEALVKGLQESAKIGAVTSESIHFRELADRYRSGATAWLIASLGAGFGLFFYVKDLQVEPKANEQTVELLARIVPHLVIITLLSTALLFCLRNFASLVHNVIVNRHRQTALTTFQTFVRSTSDPETRNAVLVQATQAIFAPQNSGFLKADSDMPQISQVTEIVRGMTGKDKD